MNNLKTKIFWHLNDYCKAECSYCPVSLRGGLLPPETKDYIRVIQLLIDNYKNMGRTIEWTINGGEPLDMNDIVTLLKLCRENGELMTLHTNGGRLWMDWWAIEPYVDVLHLSYHYWQNPKLVNYIVETFQKKNKSIEVLVPIRPDFFEEDIARAMHIESTYNIIVSKTVLYNNADLVGGMFPYTVQQLRIMRGEELVQEHTYFENTTFQERYEERINENPVYTGMLCNIGIEQLNISHQGWISGSNCNDRPLGNIWHENFLLPTGPHKCGMRACISKSDQQITKFN